MLIDNCKCCAHYTIHMPLSYLSVCIQYPIIDFYWLQRFLLALDKTGHKNTLVRGRAGSNFSLARPQKIVAQGVGLSDLIIPASGQEFNSKFHTSSVFEDNFKTYLLTGSL